MEQWANLSASGAVILCLVWGITKGLPHLIQQFREDSAQQRAEFKEELQEQRSSFQEELRSHRDQSRALAESGHQAVNNLAEAFNGLKTELQKEYATNSAILMRRDKSDDESVHD